MSNTTRYQTTRGNYHAPINQYNKFHSQLYRLFDPISRIATTLFSATGQVQPHAVESRIETGSARTLAQPL